MERKKERDTRPVFDDLNPEMFIGCFELYEKEEAITQCDGDYSADTSVWDL